MSAPHRAFRGPGGQFAIPTEDARHATPIARTLGNCLSMANYAQVAGFARWGARRILRPGEFFIAAEAPAPGVLTGSVPAEEPDAEPVTLTVRLRANAPVTPAVGRAAPARLAEGAPDLGAGPIRRLCGSVDFRRRIAAVGARETPEWQGE
jgi:hypothetical protein